MNRLAVLTAVLAVVACGDRPQAPGTTSTSQDVVDHDASRSSRSSASSQWSINREGFSLTMVANGGPLNDPDSPFFQSLGTNGRSCHTCHEPQTGMSLTPERARLRFAETRGKDPLFRPMTARSHPWPTSRPWTPAAGPMPCSSTGG